jgi:hypothetical protein
MSDLITEVPVPYSDGSGQWFQSHVALVRDSISRGNVCVDGGVFHPMTLAWSSGRAVVRRYPHRQSRGPIPSLPVDWFFQPIWCCRYILKERKLEREPRRPGVVLPWGGRDSVSPVTPRYHHRPAPNFPSPT